MCWHPVLRATRATNQGQRIGKALVRYSGTDSRQRAGEQRHETVGVEAEAIGPGVVSGEIDAAHSIGERRESMAGSIGLPGAAIRRRRGPGRVRASRPHRLGPWLRAVIGRRRPRIWSVCCHGAPWPEVTKRPDL